MIYGNYGNLDGKTDVSIVYSWCIYGELYMRFSQPTY